MSEELVIRPVDDADKAYVLSSWREAHRAGSPFRRVPWVIYKTVYGKILEQLVAANCIGAYYGDELLGFLVMTHGKRVNTLHWVQTKFQDRAGTPVRRRGVMTELLRAAELGQKFAYTLRARKEKGSKRTLDETLANHLLQSEGVVATYVPLLEWVK